MWHGCCCGSDTTAASLSRGSDTSGPMHTSMLPRRLTASLYAFVFVDASGGPVWWRLIRRHRPLSCSTATVHGPDVAVPEILAPAAPYGACRPWVGWIQVEWSGGVVHPSTRPLARIPRHASAVHQSAKHLRDNAINAIYAMMHTTHLISGTSPSSDVTCFVWACGASVDGVYAPRSGGRACGAVAWLLAGLECEGVEPSGWVELGVAATLPGGQSQVTVTPTTCPHDLK